MPDLMNTREFVEQMVTNVISNTATLHQAVREAAYEAVEHGMGTGHEWSDYRSMLNGRPSGYERSDYARTAAVWITELLEGKLNQLGQGWGHTLMLDLLDLGDHTLWSAIADTYLPTAEDLPEEEEEGEDA